MIVVKILKHVTVWPKLRSNDFKAFELGIIFRIFQKSVVKIKKLEVDFSAGIPPS